MIVGHKKQWEFFKKISGTGRLSHAYLFSGEEKLGKKNMALEWASLLFKEDLKDKQHPDLILIEPQKKEIQIGQIRELIWKLSLKPYSAPLKVAIINSAHSMNIEAQNCFLKTLEEPKDKTLIILISEYPETFLSTIVSRCEIIKFYPVEKKEIENYLKKEGLSEKAAEEISAISQGKPGVATDFLRTPQKLKEREEKIKEINRLINANLSQRFQYAKDLSQTDNLKETLDIWLSYFRSVLLKEIQEKKEYHLLKLKNILRLIQNIDFLIATTNINTRLALEILMINL